MPHVKLNEVLVLMPDDWTRIQTMIRMKEIEEEKVKSLKKKKESLSRKSKEFVKHWPNTLESLRKKKIEEFQLKLNLEEQDKLQRDREWAEIEAADRKKIIDAAKTKLFYQTDRIKGVHRGFQYSAVLKEREEQLKLKHLIETSKRERDDKYLENELKTIKEEEAQEMKKREDVKKKVMERIEELKIKIQENNEEKNKEREADLVEQKRLDGLAEEWHLNRAEEKKKRRETRLKTAEVLIESIKESEKLRELQQKKEEEEDNANSQYLKEKAKMMAVRKKRANEIREQRQKYIDLLSLKVSSKIKKMNDDNTAAILRVQKEKEEIKDWEEKKKEQLAEERKREVMASIQEKIMEHEQEREVERLEAIEILKKNKQAYDLFHQNNQEKAQKMRNDRLKLTEFHVKQHKEKQERDSVDDTSTLKYHNELMERYENEDKEFKSYTDNLMEECKKKGWNLYPIEYEAGYKYKTAETQSKKPVNLFQNQKKDLGFIW